MVRLRAVAGLGLLALAGLFALAGMLGAADEPDPTGTRVGVAVISLPVAALGAWLWRHRDGGTPAGRRWWKLAVVAVLGVVLLAGGAFAAVDGAWTAAGSMLLLAAVAFGYVAMQRNTAADDVVVTTLFLPTGPERGLLVVVPRAKQLTHVVATGVAALGLGVVAAAMRADGDGRWILMAAITGLLVLVFPWMALRMRGTAGIGVSRSGVSFTQSQRTLLVPWDHLEHVELYRMRTGRWGGHVRMVGLHVDDVANIRGLSGSLRRLANVNRAFGPALSWPVTMFDLDGDAIVELVRRYHERPEDRAELPLLTTPAAAGLPSGHAS